MAKLRRYQPVLPFIAVYFRESELLQKAVAEMGLVLGGFDKVSKSIDISYSRYYEEEMGSGLCKQWFASTILADPTRLAAWKLASNEIERKYALDGNRRVNIDPGFVGLSKVVLASLKDHPQRIPLSDGVFAETELTYEDGHWHNLPWTYWDYADNPVKSFLMDVRTALYRQLKAEGYI